MVEDVKPAALAAGVAPGVKVLPDNFIERHAEGYEWRGDSGDYTPKEHEVAMLIDFGHSLLSELPADPRLQTMRAVLKEARGVFKCLMASGEHKDAIASGVMASIDAALSALEPAPSALVAEPGEPVAWQDDPAADERWNAGLDYAMEQLCSLLGVDMDKVTWDAATETLDGDVRAVLGNILRAKYGENWGPSDASPPARQDGALREDAGKVIYRALRDYRMSNMVFESDGDPYCLVDLVSADGKSIADGENELELIAAAVAAALTQAAAPVQQAAPSGEGE